jgi:hypothetical protein
MAQSRTASYRRWHQRLNAVEAKLMQFAGKAERSASPVPLVRIPSTKSA